MPADQLTGLAASTANTTAAAREPSGWHQVCIEFADWTLSEQAAVRHLVPLLDEAAAAGVITGWWFIRKYPSWRLRFRLGRDPLALGHMIGAALNLIVADGVIRRWWPGVYEAEEAAFGGSEGMTAAHRLFAADSDAVMRLVTRCGEDGGPGRREVSIVLCTALLRGAGLEWYEQGDAWHRVTAERPLPNDVTDRQISSLTDSIKTLLAADISPGSGLFAPDHPLASTSAWAQAFHQAGSELGALARTGTLQRGLREILSYHVIFHWNRLGLTVRQQAIIARAARNAILGPVPTPPATGIIPRKARPTPELGQIAKRFPLLPRPQISCPALETRIQRVCQLASAEHRPAGREQRIDQACTVLNQAALIAADCGPPGLADDLCWQQLAIFRTAGPVTGRTAIASLQPLVNLARLDIRGNQPERGYQTLIQLADAARAGGTIQARSHSFTLNAIAPDSNEAFDTWLRDVILHDGTRALAATGRWEKAAEHASRYDDHPDQLRHARQARIIASLNSGDTGTALSLINESNPAELWEHAVAVCLQAWTILAARDAIPDPLIPALTLAASAAQPGLPGLAVFRSRLNLTAGELAIAIDPAHGHLLSRAADEAINDADPRAAREVLDSTSAARQLSTGQHERLESISAASGSGIRALPDHLHRDLLRAVSTAGESLRQCLGITGGQVRPGQGQQA